MGVLCFRGLAVRVGGMLGCLFTLHSWWFNSVVLYVLVIVVFVLL